LGHIKKVLAATELDPRTITSTGLWGDLCENVHLHYRNLRLDFSEIEWSNMRSAINSIGIEMEREVVNRNYREGDPNFLIQFMYNHGTKSNSEYYANRFLIELQRDNTVHVHYRDLRLHLTIPEFKKVAGAFIQALCEMEKLKPFPYQDATEPVRAWIDIGVVQPYDEGHRCMAIDDEHRKGIEYAKMLIGQGLPIRPILVSTSGQRLDGFKRYMAHLEAGKEQIECIIDPFGVPGGQHNQSMIDDIAN